MRRCIEAIVCGLVEAIVDCLFRDFLCTLKKQLYNLYSTFTHYRNYRALFKRFQWNLFLYPRIVSVFPSMVLVSVFQKGYNRDKLVKEVLYDH